MKKIRNLYNFVKTFHHKHSWEWFDYEWGRVYLRCTICGKEDSAPVM